MKTKLIILVLSFLFLFASLSVLAQEKQTKEKTKTTQVKSADSKVKTMCPVMPEMEGKKNINYTYKGKKYFFCCKGCIAKFKKDPDKYASK